MGISEDFILGAYCGFIASTTLINLPLMLWIVSCIGPLNGARRAEWLKRHGRS